MGLWMCSSGFCVLNVGKRTGLSGCGSLYGRLIEFDFCEKFSKENYLTRDVFGIRFFESRPLLIMYVVFQGKSAQEFL